MLKLLRLAAVSLLTSLALFSQAMDGNLVGMVRDSSGASLSGASLELENTATGIKTLVKADESGQYRFNNLPPGPYLLTAAQSGFTTTRLNLLIEANRQATVNVQLEVGSVQTSVEVREAAAAIDTTTANLSNSFNSRQALMLPVTGLGSGQTNLGVINLSLLSAGVASSGGVGYGTGPSVGGQRPTNNNFMIEGVDNNNRSVTGPQTNVSNEAVSEFSLQQNHFSVEFGHSTGGQFNTLLKTGSNELHGAAYEYFQNRGLNAVDESFKRQGITSNPRFDQNRVGGSLGGPAIRNKWFYFGNYEYNPTGQASTSPGAVFAPTADGIRTIETLAGVSKRNLDLFKQYVPVAAAQSGTQTTSVAGRDIPIGILNVVGPSFANTYNMAITSDYNLSDRDQIRARYLYNKSNTINTTNVVLPYFFTPVLFRAHLASLSEFHTFTPTLTNEFRAAYGRRVEDRPVGDYASGGLDVLPNLQFNDLSLIIGPNSNYPQGSRNNTYQLVDNMTWTKGRHTLKFGYDGRKTNSSNFFVQRVRGEYIYNSFERYLLDITPEFAERSVGGAPFVGNLLSHYLFVTDEYRLRPNLTLNLGLRYEYVGVPTGAKQQSLNAISNVAGRLEFRSPEPTKLDFAPRIGIAWSPGRDAKTSIRAGFGLGYDQVYQNLGANSLPPQFFTTIDAHVDRPNQPGFLAGGGIPGAASPITNPATARRLTSSYIPAQVRPTSLQWHLGAQRVIANDYTVEVRYLGSRGYHLPFQLQINRPSGITKDRSLPTFLQRPSQATLDGLSLTLADLPLGAAASPFTAAGFTSSITAFEPRGNSSYHGLATQVTKRFSHGLQFIGAHTWSHNIDDSTAALNSTVLTPRRPQDFGDLRPERSSSALDRRHRLSLSWVYEIPWQKTSTNWYLKNLAGNWSFSGTYIAETGAWGTARSAVDSNRNGDNAGDRTIVNPGGDMKLGSGVTALTNSRGQTVGYLANNPSAGYIVAGAGVYPTAGRNTIRLPGVNNFDLGLAKRINLAETKLVEFRAEFYNSLNHAQYTAGYPSVANLRSRTGAAETGMLTPNNAIFLRPDLAFQSNSRGGQLVLRFQF